MKKHPTIYPVPFTPRTGFTTNLVKSAIEKPFLFYYNNKDDE